MKVKPEVMFKKGDIINIHKSKSKYNWYTNDLFRVISYAFIYNLGDKLVIDDIDDIHESKLHTLPDNIYISNSMVCVCNLSTGRYDRFGEVNMELNMREMNLLKLLQ